MITSIFSFQYPDEALECIEAGASWIGLLTGDDSCPAAVSIEQAKRIFDAVGDKASKNAIIMCRDEDKTLAAAKELKPDILHLCDDKVFATPEFVKKAKEAVPGMKVMQGIAITGPEAIEDAKRYDGVADYLMLDSFVAGTSEVGATPNGVGAAGVTHDWNIDAEIIKQVSVPVIVAGGLWGGNVAAAIRATRPFGVDSLTKTTIVENGVYIRKDVEKVRDFVRIAHETAKELGLE